MTASQNNYPDNTQLILTFNVGSSTIKFAAYVVDGVPHHDQDTLASTPAVINITINLKTQRQVVLEDPEQILLDWRCSDLDDNSLNGTALALARQVTTAIDHHSLTATHRVVHGGTRYREPVAVNDEIMTYLHKLAPICPLHQPPALGVLATLQSAYPDSTQIAAFDTAFHQQRPEVWATYALPKSLRDAGVRCYGFHGLSYQSIMAKLAHIAPELLDKRLIVAHLGSGCSVTAIANQQCQDSTLGFSGLDGVPMGTRPGRLDAGVLLYMVEQGWNLQQMNDCLYKQSGLLGLSGISNDVRDLLASDHPEASFALEHFTSHAAKEIISLLISTQGADALIFTAGVGENAPEIRQMIVDKLALLGYQIDSEKNSQVHHLTGGLTDTCIHHPSSAIPIWVMTTDEQQQLLLAAFS